MTGSPQLPNNLAPATVDTLESAQAMDALHCQMARQDVNAFITYVMKDERTAHPVEQAPIHEAWHQLADTNDRLLIWSHIESGKTSQLSIGRTLFALGQDPSLRIAIVSNTHDQANKLVRAIARYIEHSPELRRVFPKLIKSDPWTSHQLFVQRHTTSKDPSIQATGIHGNILGARIDLLIMDDVLDYENCRTEVLRKDLWDWYHATLAGRVTAQGKVLVVGTAFHPDDMLHRFARQPGWKAVRYPILDENQVPRWPDRWPMERIKKKREELGPLEFARQMLCVARDDTEARFKREWIEWCLQRGVDKDLCYGLKVLPAGVRTYTGVDLAVQRHSASDATVFFDIAVHKNGDREVLNIDAGKWSGPEIVTRMIDHHRRYLSICIVENNAAQDFILQFTRGSSAIPIRPFTTGRNKANPEFGVESLATEMASRKWIIPNQGGRLAPEIDAWITEMLYYDPKAHTGDRLMASWFAREGARMGSMKVQSGFIDISSR